MDSAYLVRNKNKITELDENSQLASSVVAKIHYTLGFLEENMAGELELSKFTRKNAPGNSDGDGAESPHEILTKPPASDYMRNLEAIILQISAVFDILALMINNKYGYSKNPPEKISFGTLVNEIDKNGSATVPQDICDIVLQHNNSWIGQTRPPQYFKLIRNFIAHKHVAFIGISWRSPEKSEKYSVMNGFNSYFVASDPYKKTDCKLYALTSDGYRHFVYMTEYLEYIIEQSRAMAKGILKLIFDDLTFKRNLENIL